jgi:hypothetical protein
MLPRTLVDALQRHLTKVQRLHEADLAEGYGDVYLPYAFADKDRHADTSWVWQYVFPAAKRSIDPRSYVSKKSRHTSHTIPELRRSNEKPQPSPGILLASSAGCGLPQITLPLICNSTTPSGQCRFTSSRNCLSNALATFASMRSRERPLRA